MKNNWCILPWDTNRTIRETFIFIKNYQDKLENQDISVYIFMGIASLNSENLSNYNERNLVNNLIEGTVEEVYDNSVLIASPYKCSDEEKKSTFLLAYSDIQTFKSNVLTVFKDDYCEYMESLPYVCKCSGNRYYDLILAIKCSLSKNKEFTNYVFVYSGIFSQVYIGNDIKIIKNLILVNDGIIPITAINGFFTTPLILKENEMEVK